MRCTAQLVFLISTIFFKTLVQLCNRVTRLRVFEYFAQPYCCINYVNCILACVFIYGQSLRSLEDVEGLWDFCNLCKIKYSFYVITGVSGEIQLRRWPY